MPAPTVSVLLVDPQSEALAEAIRQDRPQLAVTAAASETAARAYLGAAAFDAVVVGGSMPHEIAPSLKRLVEMMGHATRVIGEAPSVGLSEWLGEHLGVPASQADATSKTTEPSARSNQQAILKAVSSELSHIAHALNNPLAVIDGNAQLALELSRALGVDASVVSAIEDIQGGSQSLAALFSELIALRTRIDELID